MARLPGGDRAFVDPAKIAGYLLNPAHRTGRHKARVFATVLGLQAENADKLISSLKLAAAMEEAAEGASDAYGKRYAIEFTMTHSERSAVVQSSWIVRIGEDFPRFVTAFVAKQERQDE